MVVRQVLAKSREMGKPKKTPTFKTIVTIGAKLNRHFCQDKESRRREPSYRDTWQAAIAEVSRGEWILRVKIKYRRCRPTLTTWIIFAT